MRTLVKQPTHVADFKHPKIDENFSETTDSRKMTLNTQKLNMHLNIDMFNCRSNNTSSKVCSAIIR